VVGEAGAFEPQPIKIIGMAKIAKIKIVTFLFIISPEQFGHKVTHALSFPVK
jgi:hypothetical protein